MEVAVSVSEVLYDTYVCTYGHTMYVQHSLTAVPFGLCVCASSSTKDPEFSLEDKVSISQPVSNLNREKNALQA